MIQSQDLRLEVIHSRYQVALTNRSLIVVGWLLSLVLPHRNIEETLVHSWIFIDFTDMLMVLFRSVIEGGRCVLISGFVDTRQRWSIAISYIRVAHNFFGISAEWRQTISWALKVDYIWDTGFSCFKARCILGNHAPQSLILLFYSINFLLKHVVFAFYSLFIVKYRLNIEAEHLISLLHFKYVKRLAA